MSALMESFYSTSGFNSEASLSGHPHTPPYTPVRTAKRRFERSDSPASTIGSVHPAETSSPAKKAAKRAAMDDIRVEEITERDAGYMGDIDVVYPDELEEISSTASENEDVETTDVSENEATHLTRKLSRLRCGDDQEVDFEQLRRQRHMDRRASTRVFKRTHSQTVKSDTDVTDVDALDDHDLGTTQRRLRRRVRGPREAFEDLLRSSPERRNAGAAADDHHKDEVTNAMSMGPAENMDIDVHAS